MTNIIQVPMTPKIGGTKAVDLDLLNSEVTAHIMTLGLKNMLQDCHAGQTTEKYGSHVAKVNSAKIVDAKIQSLYEGKVNARFGIRVPKADPVAKEALKIARSRVDMLVAGWEKPDTAGRKALEKLAAHYGKSLTNEDTYMAEMKATRVQVIADVAKTPAVVAEATRNVAEAPKPSDDVLASLGLTSDADEDEDTDADFDMADAHVQA